MSWRAVVDLGSVSTQLLLTDGIERRRRSVDTTMGGIGLNRAGEAKSAAIDANALDRVRAALVGFGAEIESVGAEVQAVATAPGRSVANAEVLAAVVAETLGDGVVLDVLDGETEARLAYAGACSDPELASAPALVTLDVGGASTELALEAAAWSMPIGGAVLSATYIESDPPRPEELSAALSVVELYLDDARRALPALGPAVARGTVVGLGGVVTVAAIEIGLADVDPGTGEGDGPLHGFELSRDAAEDVFRTIATETRHERANNPGLPPERVDSVVGGCAILVEAMRQLDLDRVVVSQRGLADGVLARTAAD